ncbi:MAG TPA: NAD(P)-dependent oxidoreductase [Pyrinomonadaceae bacterium]|nr:NAD(P)-dependent oxidoreductase [Pyrinomonadaceae bacterium]
MTVAASGVPNTRRVLVTGAAGCIGSALVDQCVAADYQVNVMIRKANALTNNQTRNVRVFVGDLLDADVLRKATRGVETVFHVAALSHPSAAVTTRPEEFFRVNVEGTRALLEACKTNKVFRFIFFSTVAVMHKHAGAMDEDTLCCPKTPYAQSKYEAEGVVRQYERDYGLTISILRLPLVYGPRDRGNVSKLIEAIRAKRYFILGNGKNVKTLIYSENAAAAALHLVKYDKANGQIYVVSDQVLNLDELSEAIAARVGVKLPRIHIPKPLALTMGTVCDAIKNLTGLSLPLSHDKVQRLTSHVHCRSDKIARELNFCPSISFQEGLSRTIRWHLKMQEESVPSLAPTFDQNA